LLVEWGEGLAAELGGGADLEVALTIDGNGRTARLGGRLAASIG
jgi:tRNA A37 threonylcarbamoyladenosine biosynthesis protein TsaE